MEPRLRLWIACLALSAAGCPRAPSPVPPPSSPHSPRAGATQVEPAPAPSARPSAPNPTPARSEPAPTPTSGPLEPESIPLGTQAHPWPGVSLSFERSELLGVRREGTRGQARAALLSISLGQVFSSSDVFAGDRLRVGGALLEVLRVEPGSLRFRWLSSPAQAAPPQLLPARPRMRAPGLYRFDDGAVLGVGRVTTLAKRDGAPVEVVTLSVFPPNYQANPLQDYEVLPRLVVGKPVGSTPLGGRRLSLVQLQADGDEPGWIRVGERRE